jgi:hypothetical protein
VLGVLCYQAIVIDFLYIAIPIYIILGLINAFFLLTIIYYLFYGYLAAFADKLDPIRDKIVEKKPHLMENKSLRPYLVN